MYEARLLKFLKDNPNVRMTTRQIAGAWKRAHQPVRLAAQNLFIEGKLAYVGPTNYLKLKRRMCEGTRIV